MQTGGDTCDLTGKPRSTEFRFICDPKSLHAFESIAETETCNYMAVVHTSLLCQHPDYSEKTVVPKKILCISSNDAQLGETRPQRMVKMAESLAIEEVFWTWACFPRWFMYIVASRVPRCAPFSVLVVASCHHAHRTRHLRCHGHISPEG